MTSIGWWFVDALSRTLAPEEREAVLGDFAETGEPAGRALRLLLGLIVRRQVALWKDWRPWLTFAFAAIPLALALSFQCRRLASVSAIYAWLYLNNWDNAHIENPVFRADLMRYSADFLLRYLLLACGSWTGGFILSRLSGRAIAVIAPLSCVMLLQGGLPFSANPGNANAAVFSSTFYRAVFPAIVWTSLILIPICIGMFHGAQTASAAVMRWRARTALAIMFILAGIGASAEMQSRNNGNFAPPWTLKDASQSAVSLRDYRHKVVLLNFWATWCGGCKQEIPWLSEFDKTYREKGLAVIGASLDEEGWIAVTPFLADGKASYRIVLADDIVLKRYRVTSLPVTFLIDRQGRLAATYLGRIDNDKVDNDIQRLLSKNE